MQILGEIENRVYVVSLTFYFNFAQNQTKNVICLFQKEVRKQKQTLIFFNYKILLFVYFIFQNIRVFKM